MYLIFYPPPRSPRRHPSTPMLRMSPTTPMPRHQHFRHLRIDSVRPQRVDASTARATARATTAEPTYASTASRCTIPTRQRCVQQQCTPLITRLHPHRRRRRHGVPTHTSTACTCNTSTARAPHPQRAPTTRQQCVNGACTPPTGVSRVHDMSAAWAYTHNLSRQRRVHCKVE
jgi:hypothetical protein